MRRSPHRIPVLESLEAGQYRLDVRHGEQRWSTLFDVDATYPGAQTVEITLDGARGNDMVTVDIGAALGNGWNKVKRLAKRMVGA